MADPCHARHSNGSTENGYDIPPEGAGLIGPYLADGMYLLALRLTKGSDTGSIRPIKLTYAAEAPDDPDQAHRGRRQPGHGRHDVGARRRSRAVPFNYNALELNEARINWFNASSNYGDVVTEAAERRGRPGLRHRVCGPVEPARQRGLAGPTRSRTGRASESATYVGFNDIF